MTRTHRFSLLKRSLAVAAGLGLAVGLLAPASALADPPKSHQAIPFTFVGKAGDCGTLPSGPPYPPGSNIVTAAWLKGMGLPDNTSQMNTQLPDTTNPNGAASRKDPHTGLLLSKNGPTPDCSSAGAEITNVKGLLLTELNFDYRNGSHCGAGAPRFNVVVEDSTSPTGETTLFFGCAGGTHTPAPQDPSQWTHVSFTTGLPTAANKVKRVSIVFDEGTDTPSTEDPNGVGLVVLDNISINKDVITSGPSQAKECTHDNGKKKGNDDKKDKDDCDDD
jgi:hypothetical protein